MKKKYLLKMGGRKNDGSRVMIKATGPKDLYSQGAVLFGPFFLGYCSVFSFESGCLTWHNPEHIEDEALGIERNDPAVSWCDARDDVVYSDDDAPDDWTIDDDNDLVPEGGSLITRREQMELREPDDWIIEYDEAGNALV